MPYLNIFEYCVKYDSSNVICLQCQEGYNLTSGICCPNGMYAFKDSSNQIGCTYNGISNCEI